MDRTSPINPLLLRWARETSGLSLDDVARRLKRKTITVETVASWESGETSPNYIQLETLAYDVYKRPLAIFFFPEPPVEETPQQAFRTLPASEIQRLSPRLRLLLRRARAMQINLEELYAGENPAERQILRDVPFDLDTPVAELAAVVRQFLDIELSQQMEWRSADIAFKAWRHALEDHGVFVFKDAFKNEVISGFSLNDHRFPLIYVNNSKAATHQIFTLFHELAHLLSGTGGIDTPDDSYIAALRGRNRRVEILCNGFAAAFLVPAADFDRRIAPLSINEETIRALAEQYNVSGEVVARRLTDCHLITRQAYEQMVSQWRSEGTGRTGAGGNYYLTQGAYLGERYLELAFSRLYQNKISVDQLADYLGVKAKSIAGMEALLFAQGAAA